MNITTPNDVWGMATGMPIPLFQGKVKKVWKPKTGEKDGKEWSMQNIVFHSSKGDLQATVWNAPECPRTWEEEEVTIESFKGPKGWIGTITSEYQGKMQLKVSDKAKIQLASKHKEKAEDNLPYNEDPPREPRPVASSPDDAKTFLKKAANMMLMCLKTATDIRAAYTLDNRGEEMTPEQFQAVTSSLWIVCDRKGLISTMSEHERGDA